MKQQIRHLIDWSQWGCQWVAYLRKKEDGRLASELNRFEAAFAEIGRAAAAIRDSRGAVAELMHLTSRAEALQEQFHDFLRVAHEQRSILRADAEKREGNPADHEHGGGLREASSDTAGQPFGPVQQHEVQEDHTPVRFHRRPVPIKRPVPIGAHVLPPLPYDYDALEPHIDAETMRLHHDRHHKSYVDGLNRAELKMAEARKTGDFSLIKHWEREAAYHGAGHYLHTIFWNVMSPRGGGEPAGMLAEQINRDFGSFGAFQQHFSRAAEQVEGGGWALLVWAPRAQRLEILTAEKHQNLSQWDVVPLLVLDVWEHAYYLRYQNERARYIAAWWNVVNWPHVQYRFEQARHLRWQPY